MDAETLEIVEQVVASRDPGEQSLHPGGSFSSGIVISVGHASVYQPNIPGSNVFFSSEADCTPNGAGNIWLVGGENARLTRRLAAHERAAERSIIS